MTVEIFGFGMRIAYDVRSSRRDWRSPDVDYGPSSYMITMGGACFIALLAGILQGHQQSLTEDCKINTTSTRPRSLLVLDVLIFLSSFCILLGFVSFFSEDGHAIIAGPIFILVGLAGDLLALILVGISAARYHVRSWRTRPGGKDITGLCRRFYVFWRHCPWTIVVLYLVTILTFVRTIVRSANYVSYLLWKLVDLHFDSTGDAYLWKVPSPEEKVPTCDGCLMLLSIATILTLRPNSVASNTIAREEGIGEIPPVNPDSVQVAEDQAVEKL